MNITELYALCLVIAFFSAFLSLRKIRQLVFASAQRPRALPVYHSINALLLCALPPLVLIALWLVGESLFLDSHTLGLIPDSAKAEDGFSAAVMLARIQNIAAGITVGEMPGWMADAAAGFQMAKQNSRNLLTAVSLILCCGLGIYSWQRVSLSFGARQSVERLVYICLVASSIVAIFTTIGIVFSVIFESIRFFKIIPPLEFLTGLTWNPEFEGAARAGSGQGGIAAYGSVPLFVGTFLISAIALSVSIPVGLLSAIYLSEYASKRARSVLKPMLEILAGVPTVVYGFFAALTIAPFFRETGAFFGLDVASESALAAGFVMGIMIIPFISSLSDDVINAVPQSLRDAAYGLGSTRSETVKKVVLPAALSGIVASVILAVSRAVGETMIVVMAAGLAANLSVNPLDAVTTVTAQIVTILVGDQEFESAKTLSAFALALTLIIITLGLNFIALRVVKKYREQYD